MKEQRHRHLSAAETLSLYLSHFISDREEKKRITCGHFVRSRKTVAEKLLDRFL